MRACLPCALVFEADQHPHTKWMYELGVNFFPGKRWRLFADVAADFNGGYASILGPAFASDFPKVSLCTRRPACSLRA